MSAFLVSDNHLHAICSFADKLKARGITSLPDHGHLFVAFKNANLLALQDRYGDPIEDVAPSVRKIPVPVVSLLKACHCLDYQCSDWSKWPESFAKKYLDVIQSAAVMDLPGYEEAPWAIA